MEADPDHGPALASREGYLRAFEHLVERHRDVVFRLCARLIGEDEAQDVTQDTFLRAFHRLPRFRGEGTFRAWVLRIAHNRAVSLLETRQASERIGAGPAEPRRQETPADALEYRERLRRLDIKLKGLAPAHRAVLVLRDIEGLTYEEIAQVTETPLGSVKARLHRARNELIDVLRANTYDWELPR